MSFLQIKNLNVTYRENNKNNVILRNIYFNLEQGDICTILGESGSGKTTLLKSISGLTPNIEGEIILNNKILSKLPVHKREIGYIPQDPTLFQNLNVYENIAFGLRLKTRLEQIIRERVEYLANIVGISEILEKSVNQISGGQAQRVSLCRALAPEPMLLLLDEPFSSLDSNLRYKLALEFKRIQKTLKITTIHVTHDQYEARLMADYIGIITNKTLSQFDYKENIKPINWQIAQILGYPNVISPDFYSFFSFPSEFNFKFKNGGYFNPEELILSQKNNTKITGTVVEKNPILDNIILDNDENKTKLNKLWIHVIDPSRKRSLYLLGSLKESLRTKKLSIENLLDSFIPF